MHALLVASRVGMVMFLRQPSAVCFLIVVALASAAVAALRLCLVYSEAAELAVFLERLLLLSWHLL